MRAVAIAAAAAAAWCAWPTAATRRLPARQLAAPTPSTRLAAPPRRLHQRSSQHATAELPLALDLMAVCVSAGLSPPEAVDVLGRTLPGELGAAFESAGRALMLGAPVDQVWSRSCAQWPELRRVAEAMSHTERRGTELGAALVSLAADQRRLVRLARMRGARRVGVLAAAPLGFCFLPAFVLIAVVPLVAGLLRQLPAF